MCQDYSLNKSQSEQTKHTVGIFYVHVVVHTKLHLYYLIYNIFLTLLINIRRADERK